MQAIGLLKPKIEYVPDYFLDCTPEIFLKPLTFNPLLMSNGIHSLFYGQEKTDRLNSWKVGMIVDLASNGRLPKGSSFLEQDMKTVSNIRTL